MSSTESTALTPVRAIETADESACSRREYHRPRVTVWGALDALTKGGPASGGDDTMTGSTTFGFVFFGTDEWQLFRQGGGR